MHPFLEYIRTYLISLQIIVTNNNNSDFEWVLGLNSPAQSHLSPSGSVQQAVTSLVEDSDDGLIILLYIGDRGWMWVCR